MRRSPPVDDLISMEDAFLALRSQSEVNAFLNAVLTDQENTQLRNRWAAVQLRARGLTQMEMGKLVGISGATANRVAAALRTSGEIFHLIIARAGAHNSAKGQT